MFSIKAAELDMSLVESPPIKFLHVEGDETCVIDKQKPFEEAMQSEKSFETLTGVDHSFVVGDNDDPFFEMLMSNLNDYGRPLPFLDCWSLMFQ